MNSLKCPQPFCGLNHDAWRHVFGFVGAEELNQLRVVSRGFKTLAETPALWMKQAAWLELTVPAGMQARAVLMAFATRINQIALGCMPCIPRNADAFKQYAFVMMEQQSVLQSPQKLLQIGKVIHTLLCSGKILEACQIVTRFNIMGPTDEAVDLMHVEEIPYLSLDSDETGNSLEFVINRFPTGITRDKVLSCGEYADLTIGADLDYFWENFARLNETVRAEFATHLFNDTTNQMKLPLGDYLRVMSFFPPNSWVPEPHTHAFSQLIRYCRGEQAKNSRELYPIIDRFDYTKALAGVYDPLSRNLPLGYPVTLDRLIDIYYLVRLGIHCGAFQPSQYHFYFPVKYQQCLALHFSAHDLGKLEGDPDIFIVNVCEDKRMSPETKARAFCSRYNRMMWTDYFPLDEVFLHLNEPLQRQVALQLNNRICDCSKSKHASSQNPVIINLLESLLRLT